MTERETAHIDPGLLEAYAQGRLDDGRMAEVEAHVAACESCGERIRSLPEDRFVALLRASAGPPPRGTTPGAVTPAGGGDQETGPAGFQVPSSFVLTGGPPTDPVTSGPPASGPPSPPEVPAALADHPRYRIVKWLGSGGMGAVYLAEHRLMERRVALKVIHRDLTDQSGLVERFRREVRAAARLHHPNIVTSFDAEQAGSVHFLVMEFVEGTDLAKAVRARGPLPVAEACDCVRQAALGLQHAHEHGMVHRDIKPQNLMLTPLGQVKVLDFGLALFAGEAGPHDAVTASGAVLGTADYIAPEQAEDSHTADIRADLYSLGCTLYYLLAGHPPFPGGTLMEKLAAHSRRNPKPLASIRDDLPEGLGQVLERMMAKDPARRYRTPAEVARALAPFSAAATAAAAGRTPPPEASVAEVPARTALASGPWPGEDTFAATDPGPSAPARPGPSVRRSPTVRAAATLLLLILLLGGGLLGLAIYRIRTDKGELVIETEDPDIEVIVKRGGELVQIVDPRTTARIELRPGDYDLSLPEGTRGMRLSAVAMTLKRGDKAVVSIRHVPPPTDSVPARPASALLATVEEVGEIARFVSPKDHVGPGVFLPDGRRVVYTTGVGENWTMGSDPAVWVGSIEEGQKKEVRKLAGHEPGGMALALLPDGRHALTGGAGGTLRLWDLEAGQSRRLKQYDSAAERVCVAADGRRAALVRGDTIFLIDPTTGQELRAFRGHRGRIWGLAFCPDGRELVSCGPDDHTIRVWDPETGREIRHMRHGHGVSSIAVFPDGRRVLSGSWDWTIGVWDLETGQQLRRIHGLANKFGAEVAVSPDGRRGLFGLGSDHSVRLWDFETGREVDRLVGHAGAITGVGFSPDGRRAVSTAFDRTVRVWALPAGRTNGPDPAGEVMHYVGHAGHVEEAALSPDGRHVLSGSHDRTVRLWDIESGRELRRFDHSAAVLGVAFSPDGRKALSGGADKVVRLWDLEAGGPSRDFEGHGDAVQHVAFSPRGDLILSTSGGGSDPSVRLWDVGTGRELRRLAGHRGRYVDADFSPDGRLILSGGDDGGPILWDVETGGEVRRLPGHPARVECVAFTPDGRRALTGCHDKIIRLWDLETGGELRRFEGHAGGIVWVDVSPDGRRLLSSSFDDHTLVLWDLESGRRLQTFPWGGVSPTRGHFTPDGRRAAWAGSHESLRLFRLPGPAPDGPAGEARRPEAGGHGGGGVNGITVSPDDRRAHPLRGLERTPGAVSSASDRRRTGAGVATARVRGPVP